MDQINSVIVKITMDSTGKEPRLVVEEVTAQPGHCFVGAENLLRARFECLCCKTGYVVLPLITPTVKIEVSIAEDDPTSIQQVVKHVSEDETGIALGEAVNSVEEQKQSDEFDDFKMEAELFLREDSDEMASLIRPMENQARVDQIIHSKEGDFERSPAERPLDEVVNSNEDDEHKDSEEMKADMTFTMDVDADFFETLSVKQQACVDQTLEVKESEDLTLSEEQSLKLQCLRSDVVIRLVRVDEKAREGNASVAPAGPQKRNVEGGFYQCDICKAIIKHRGKLIRHMKTHMGIRFSCSECPKSFSTKSALNSHKKRFHQIEFRICEVCRRSKTCTKAEYYSHLRHRHPEFHFIGPQPKMQNFNGVDFPCVYCEPHANFSNFEELEDHLRVTHDRSFACTHCPTACNEKVHLKNHIESVHEKKTFKCPKCGKVFAWERNLRSHIHSHK